MTPDHERPERAPSDDPPTGRAPRSGCGGDRPRGPDGRLHGDDEAAGPARSRRGSAVGSPRDHLSPPPLSIQERLYPELTCFGCGHANPKGLRLRSFEAAEGVTARFVPRPEHDNGVGYLNGGIIATVLDCHSAAAVICEADRRGWRSTDDPSLSYVTAGIDVRYLRPTPLGEPLDLWAAVTEASESEMTVDVELRWGGKPRAAAVATWKRWRPR